MSSGASWIANIDMEIDGLEYFYDVALQPDGKIVAVGGACVGDDAHVVYLNHDAHKFIIARFNPDGTIDDTFGFGGGLAMDAPNGAGQFRSVKILAGGRIVAVGDAITDPEVEDRDIFVARFDPNGILDTSFGNCGWYQYDAFGNAGPPHPPHGPSIQLLDDGSLMLSGNTSVTPFLVSVFDF